MKRNVDENIDPKGSRDSIESYDYGTSYSAGYDILLFKYQNWNNHLAVYISLPFTVTMLLLLLLLLLSILF